MDVSVKLVPYIWQEISQLEYLNEIINSGLLYVRLPMMVEGYLDASLIINIEDYSSIRGWVFLLGEVPFHGLPRNKIGWKIWL